MIALTGPLLSTTFPPSVCLSSITCRLPPRGGLGLLDKTVRVIGTYLPTLVPFVALWNLSRGAAIICDGDIRGEAKPYRSSDRAQTPGPVQREERCQRWSLRSVVLGAGHFYQRYQCYLLASHVRPTFHKFWDTTKRRGGIILVGEAISRRKSPRNLRCSLAVYPLTTAKIYIVYFQVVFCPQNVTAVSIRGQPTFKRSCRIRK